MRSINERRYVRVKCMTPAGFKVGTHSYEGTCRDVSLCGAYVMSEEPVRLGARVRLETHLPGAEGRTLLLRGRVVRRVSPTGDAEPGREPEAPGFGVDFAALALATRTAIEEYVRNTFRVFRRLQFELSRARVDGALIRDLVRETYLPEHSYTPEILKNIVAAELKEFRLKPI